MKYLLTFLKTLTLWFGVILIAMPITITILWIIDDLPIDVSIQRLLITQLFCLVSGVFMLWVSSKINTQIL